MADLQRKTANLVSMSEPQGDGYVANSVVGITGDGRESIISTTAFFVTEYIPVSEGTYYYYSDLYRATGNNGKFMFYNANKEYIGYTERQPVMQEQPVYELSSFSVPNAAAYMRMNIDKSSTKNCLYTSQLPSYESYGWVHSLRKLTTATEAVENPLYSDGTAITAYTIQGNTVQNGIPTPSNPVDVNGVGERTENIITNRITGVAINNSGVVQEASGYDLLYGKVEPNKTYTIQLISSTIAYVIGYFTQEPVINSVTYNNSRTVINFNDEPTPTVTIPTGVNYIAIRVNSGKNVMINEGSTAKPYEPYGYKIPISNGQQTTDIYLGSTQAVRQIKKLVLTGEETGIFIYSGLGYIRLSDGLGKLIAPYSDKLLGTVAERESMPAFSIKQYASDITPAILAIKADFNFSTEAEFKSWLAENQITIWYVLATPETSAVNEPLMKIGTYADTLSNATAIPTTEGANSITVDTTVQPSEFTATWTGWHDAEVKEKSRNLFDGDVEQGTWNANITPIDKADSSVRCRVSNFIDVAENTQYTISLVNAISGLQIIIVYVDDNYSRLSETTWSSLPLTFNTPTNCKYVEAIFRKSNNANIIPSECGNLMLNTGSTALPYEPYWK